METLATIGEKDNLPRKQATFLFRFQLPPATMAEKLELSPGDPAASTMP